jgi:hypothetical protein
MGHHVADRHAVTPSPSLLLFLFADRVLPAGAGFHVPCSQTKVSFADLIGEVWACAFWNLNRQGLIGLEPEDLVVHCCNSADRPGLEGAILATLQKRRWWGSPWTVGDIARRKENWPVRVLCREGAEHGCFRMGSLFGEGRKEWDGLEPICGEIKKLRPFLTETRPRWEHFRELEPELYARLRDACRPTYG